MTEPLLRVENVTKRFGGFVALNDVSLAVAEGERLGVIGPNGAGKSTLVNCISGLLRPEAGRVYFAGIDITALPAHRRARLGIARSFQIPRPFRSMTLEQNLAIPRDYAARAATDSDALLAQLGLGTKAGALPGTLTQIELRKLELARALAARPRLVIADEVMAGLSHAEVDEMLTLLFALNEIRHHHSDDRAHHARGDAVLAAHRRARRRPQNRGRRARRHSRRQGGRACLSRRLD